MDRLTFDPTKILLSLHVDYMGIIDFDVRLRSGRSKLRIIYLIEIFTFSQNERKKLRINKDIDEEEYKDMRENTSPERLKIPLDPIFVECMNFMKEVLRLFFYHNSFGKIVRGEIITNGRIIHKIMTINPLINNMQSLYDRIKLTQDISDIDARNTMIIITYRFLKSMENMLLTLNQKLITKIFLKNTFWFNDIEKTEINEIYNALTGKTRREHNFFYVNDDIDVFGKSKKQDILGTNIRIQIEYDRIFNFFGPDITILEASRNVEAFDRAKDNGNAGQPVPVSSDTQISFDTQNSLSNTVPVYFILKESVILFSEKSLLSKRTRSRSSKRSKSPRKSRSRSPKKSRTKKTKSSPRKIKKKK